MILFNHNCRKRYKNSQIISKNFPFTKQMSFSTCKSWSRWEDNIRMDIKEIGFESVYWIHLAQHKDQCHVLLNTVIYLRDPLKAENFFTS
jgi:hypothetical protein